MRKETWNSSGNKSFPLIHSNAKLAFLITTSFILFPLLYLLLSLTTLKWHVKMATRRWNLNWNTNMLSLPTLPTLYNYGKIDMTLYFCPLDSQRGIIKCEPNASSLFILTLLNDVLTNIKMLLIVQGLLVPFACLGSGDPVRVLHLYTTNTLDTLWSIYCWDICTTCHYQNYVLLYWLIRSCSCWSLSVTTWLTDWLRLSPALYCAVPYIAACVEISRTVLWDRSIVVHEE